MIPNGGVVKFRARPRTLIGAAVGSDRSGSACFWGSDHPT